MRPKKPAPVWSEDDVPAFAAKSTPAPSPGRSRKRQLTLPMSSFEPVEVSWLWYPYIARGKLCTLDGDPGVGKSWVTCAIAAAFTRGDRLPGQERPLTPCNVLMLNSEDDPNDTLRPRLDATGADVTRVHVPPEFFTIDTDEGRQQLLDMIRSVSAGLVVLDPVQAWMGGKVDMNKANEVRSIMGPLATIASETDTAMVIVRHVRKGQAGEKAIYKGLGSIDGIASVRSGLYASDEGSRKVIHHIKSNLAPKGHSIPFATSPRFTFGEPFTPEDELAPPRAAPSITNKPKNIDKARLFLLHVLASGRRTATEVIEMAQAAGFAQTTLNRAKEGHVATINKAGTWYWELDQRLQATATGDPRGIPQYAGTAQPAYTDPDIDLPPIMGKEWS